MAKPLSTRQFAALATCYLRPRPHHELRERGILDVTIQSLERRGLLENRSRLSRGTIYSITDTGRATIDRPADVARGTVATSTTTGAPSHHAHD